MNKLLTVALLLLINISDGFSESTPRRSIRALNSNGRNG